MLRNGLEARVVSQLNMLPFACPPAMVVWSADIAMAVMGPDSTAGRVSQPWLLFRERDGVELQPFVPGPIIILMFWL